MNHHDIENNWTEDLSRQFMDYGRYFVPERELQMHLIAGLLSDLDPKAFLVELCCGEGLLTEVLLENHPLFTILALDGSIEMLDKAQHRLSRFSKRCQCQLFDLASDSWRGFKFSVDAIVSSLAIHHLTGPLKQVLFQDLYKLLSPGGLLIIADVLEVASMAGRKLAADEWDRAVRQRSFDLDGNYKAFEFFEREGWNMHRHLDPNDIDKPSPIFSQLKWLENAGFIQIDVNWLLAGHAIFSARKPLD
ncbi:MAG: class I SAM-dependent methyltransferase [Anaerolineaceae bacterium]|nr:class I SAM-dependent methyltransferase [Anaerolineaceae bacterium]MBN2676684.1 class I SAM-dependent methyltransferase [Anaerolineaceae bacterium]